MAEALRQYDPKKVIITWNAIPLHIGIIAGTFLTLERDVATWSSKVGIDGELGRVRTNNFRGFARFTLRNGSPTNTALSGLLQADEFTGVVVGPMLIVDFSGFTLYASPIAYLEGWPIDKFGIAEGTREWTLICNPLIPFPAGSQQL